MVIHLVNSKTGHYFRDPAQWTAKRQEATDFKSGSRAIELAYQQSIKDVELLLAFDLPTYREVRMPLR
jgi:hypothetical protein